MSPYVRLGVQSLGAVVALELVLRHLVGLDHVGAQLGFWHLLQIKLSDIMNFQKRKTFFDDSVVSVSVLITRIRISPTFGLHQK